MLPLNITPSISVPNLALLQREIDRLDDRMVALFQRRLGVARRIGAAKAHNDQGLRLRPDREQTLIEACRRRSRPVDRAALVAFRREVIGWGVASQTPLQIRVWSPHASVDLHDAARRRFGAAPKITSGQSAETVLAEAEHSNTVAVLALSPDSGWWTRMVRRHPDLVIFDGLAVRSGMPTAVCVGRVPRASLPRGPQIIVTAGGDAGDGADGRRSIAHWYGWTLAMTEASTRLGSDAGCVGALTG